MKTRFSLSAKILLWFFLNLVLLVGIFYFVLSVQFRLGLDLLISGRDGERIQGLANVLSAELAERPHDEWNNLLERFGAGYGVQFLLVRPDGGVVAGLPVEFPRAIANRLRERVPMTDRRLTRLDSNAGTPAGALNVGFPPVEDFPELGPLRQEAGRTNEFPRRLVRDGLPPGTRNPEGRPQQPPGPNRFMVRTDHPVRYWVGVQLPPLEAQRPQARLVLLAVSDSLRGGGLFFDYTPWLITAAAVIVLSVLFWLPLVRGITRSLAQMTRATGEIAEGRFETRVPEGRQDELGSLACAVNRMAERLTGFVSGQKRFLGDTAHELCAPIARMQMAIGILEQRADEKQKPYVNDVREELQHISGLVNELLSFSKAGLHQQPARLQTVALAEIARRVAEREGRGGDTVEVTMEETLQAQAEPELLTRALANLTRNALRYAGDAGPVRITARREQGDVLVLVSDDGPGVPEAALQKIFDPFYRLEESRSRDTGGVGLGLAIVKTCVEACAGTVTARNRTPHGLEVTIRLKG